MNLELLIAPSGFGKTHFMLEDIEKNRHANKIIILTPEQNSFNFETILCEKFRGTFNIDVMNFSSLTKKLGQLLGLDDLKRLGEDIKPFYFYKAAQNLKNSDNFLVKRILNDSNFIEVVEEIITELKDYQISVNSLEEYLEKNSNLEKTRREKLEAILEFYIEYTALLKVTTTYDKQDYINELLLYSQYVDLSDYIFYIDAYYNFTAQEYSYIEKLILKSKKVVLSVIADANRYFNVDLAQLAVGYELDKIKYKPFYLVDVYKDDKYKLDIFRKSHEMMASINEILRRNKDVELDIIAFTENKEQVVPIKMQVQEALVTTYELYQKHKTRFEGKANRVLATKYYKNFKDKFELDDSIKLICAKNKELEVKEVARQILKLRLEKGIENTDIAILYRDNTYENYMTIFRDYNLDVYLDKNSNVSNHRLIKFLDLVLNFENLDFKAGLLNILKTRLTDFENIYRRKVVSYLLTGNNVNLTTKEIKEAFSQTSNEQLEEVISLSPKLVNIGNNKITLKALFAGVKVISIDKLENILNTNLIYSKKSLEKAELISKSADIDSFIFELCKGILLELLEKIETVSKFKNTQTKRYIKKIEELFNYCNIQMYLDKEDGEYEDIEELKIDSIDRQVYKKTLELLNDITDKFGDEKIEYEKFVELAIMGLKTINYRSIPEINEAIIMSSMDLAKVENKKVVFVIGFNKDVLPVSKKHGLLDDKDKEDFFEKNLFISPTTEAALIDEEFVAYIALTRAREKTYISYSLLDKSFKENFSSPYLSVVKNLFPNLEEIGISKMLEFNLSFYDYYKANIDKLLTKKEYNYIFSKAYRRFMEVKDSGTKEAEKLAELLIVFLEGYKFDNEKNDNQIYEVRGELSDRVYFDKNTLVKNYLDKIIRDYRFELSNKSIKKFLQERESYFSKFSISKISDYEKNPYLFFIKRVLDIKEEQTIDIDNLVIGRFFHAVMADERTIRFIKASGEKLSVSEEYDNDIVNKFEVRKLIHKVVFDNSNKDIVETLRLIELLSTHNYILQTMLRRIELAIAVEIKYCSLTKYSPTFLEKPFELTINNEKITCKELESGKVIEKQLGSTYNIPNIKFVGFIDRVDTLGKNIVVIDYKSSQTDFSLESLELGFISQILTYSLACEMLFNKKTEDILGIFYREIARIGKDINAYRLRGLGNKDLILGSDFVDNNADVMYIRTTKKGGIHGADDYKAYTSKELDILVEKNLHNILKLLEEIYSFNYSLTDYEVNGQYEAEKDTLFNYSANIDTRLEYKKKITLKGKDLKAKILSE